MGNSWSNTAVTTLVIPTGATTGARVVIDGTTGFITVYNAANQAVDTIGGPNGDITSTDGTSNITLASGEILFGNTANTVAGVIQVLIDSLFITGPASAAFPVASQLFFGDGTGSATGTTSPAVHVRSGTGGAADLIVQGTVLHATAGGTVASWQVPTPSAGFALGSAASANYQNMQFRLDAENNLMVCGTMQATAPGAAGAYTLFVLPAAYRPLKIQAATGVHVSNVDVTKAVLRVNVDLSGSVGIYTTAAVAVGDGFYFSVTVPLGNIP